MIAEELQALAHQLDEYEHDPKNLRRHDDASVAGVASSLEQFGQQKPIVFLEIEGRKVVIAGNGTLAAARKLGWPELAGVKFTGTPEVARAFAAADNRTAELSTWDYDALSKELAELSIIDGLDLAAFQFDDLTSGRPVEADFIAEYLVPAPSPEVKSIATDTQSRSVAKAEPDGQEHMGFSLHVLSGEKRLIDEAIVLAKARGAASSSAALAAVCAEYTAKYGTPKE